MTAVEVLAAVGEHAMLLHKAAAERNAARLVLRKLRIEWQDETGEWYDSHECRGEVGADEMEAAILARAQANKALRSARSRFNRSVKSAAAALAVQPGQKETP